MKKSISPSLIVLGIILTGCGTAPTKLGFRAKAGYSSNSEGQDKAPTKIPDVGSSTTGDIGKDPVKTGVPEVKVPETTTPVVTTKPVVETKPGGTMPVDCKTFKWESIQKPEDALCFKSIPEAVASLPDTVKPFWTLMKNSRSAQISSLENPRIIMSAPDGSFLMGTSTDPKARKDLELAVFDYEKAEWQFAGIDFSTTPPTVEKELCKSCHGNEPHPIWTRYGGWTGAFAANNTLTADESAFLKKVVAGGSDVPELLKLLSYRGASSYDTGRRLAPNTKSYGGEENAQVLNYVTMQKAAQITVAKIMRDATIKMEDMLAMSAEISCGTNSGAMKKFGYSIAAVSNQAIT